MLDETEDEPKEATPKLSPSLWWVHGGLILSQLCWGSAAVTNRIGLGGISPVLFAFVRELCAGPLLLFLAGFFENRSFLPPLPSRHDAIPLVLAGFSIFVDQFCSLAGVKLADSSSLSAWQPSQLVFTTGIAICLGWEFLTIGKALGIVLTIVGALMLAVLDSGGSSEHGNHRPPRRCMASSAHVVHIACIQCTYYMQTTQFACVTEQALQPLWHSSVFLAFVCLLSGCCTRSTWLIMTPPGSAWLHVAPLGCI